MGPTNLIKSVIERNFEGTVYFGRVTVKPGKPTTFASPTPFEDEWEGVGRSPFLRYQGTSVCVVDVLRVVVPVLRKMGG